MFSFLREIKSPKGSFFLSIIVETGRWNSDIKSRRNVILFHHSWTSGCLNSRAFSKLQQHQPTVMTSALPPSIITGIASFELKPIIVPRLTP